MSKNIINELQDFKTQDETIEDISKVVDKIDKNFKKTLTDGEKRTKEFKSYLEIDIIKDLLNGKAYEPYFDTHNYKAVYKIWGGAKYSGKSEAAGRRIFSKWLSNPNRNVIILTTTIKKNTTSTFPTIYNIIKSLGRQFDMPDTWNVDGIKGRERRSDYLFKWHDYPIAELEYRPTGQKILFKSLDNDSVSSIKLFGEDMFIDTIWAEEMISVSDIGVVEDINGIDNFPEFLILQSSLLRAPKHMEDQLETEVLFSNNLWNPTHWLMKDFIDKYIPYNHNNMTKYGIDYYYNPNFRNGQGLLVSRSNYLVIKHLIPSQNIKTIEGYEGDEERYLRWGETQPLPNSLFKDVINNIPREVPKNNSTGTSFEHNIYGLGVGVDVGFKNDATSAQLLGTDVIRSGTSTRPAYNKLYFIDEYFHSNKNKNRSSFKDWTEQAIDIVEKLIEWGEEYREFKVVGMNVFVDSANQSFIWELKKVASYISKNSGQNLSWIKFRAIEGKNAPEKRIGERLKWWKEFIDSGMLHVSENNVHLFEELMTVRVNKQGKDTSRTDDARNAAEYSWLPYLKKFVKQYEKKRREMINDLKYEKYENFN